MEKVKFSPKRAAAMIAVICCVGFLFMHSLVNATGLFASEDSDLGKEISKAEMQEMRAITTEGIFLDWRGNAITEATEAGKPAMVCFDESYSFLIGYNSTLYGTSGLRNRYYDKIFDGGEDNVGAQVTLTTDNELQEFCYKILGPYEGSVIIMRADGALLACTSRSSGEVGYNVNLISQNSKDTYNKYLSYDSFFLNRSLMAADPPGSTFKIITGAAQLESGLGGFIIDDPLGYVEINGGRIHNYDAAPAGTDVGLEKALNNSVNVYFAQAAIEMRAYNMQVMADRMLMNQPINLNFGKLYSNFDLDTMNDNYLLAQTAFGQGRTTMSPMHIAMIMNAVINDGKMMKPYLVQSIDDDGKNLETTEQVVLAEPFSASTASVLKKYLHSTAEGYKYYETSYGMVYAKTGTADQANGKNHVYMLMGVEDTPVGDCVILIDRRNVTGTSSTLKSEAESILNYLLTMQDNTPQQP